MDVQVITDSVVNVHCDALIVGLFEEELPGSAVKAADQILQGQLHTILRGQPHQGKYGETISVYTVDAAAKTVILLGLGKKSEITLDKVRALSGIALREAGKLHAKVVASTLHSEFIAQFGLESVQAVTEGAILGLYEFTYYKTNQKTAARVEKILVIESSASVSELTEIIRVGKAIAESVNFCRDLVNHPACHMIPEKMAQQASDIANQFGLEISVLGPSEIEQEGMHALLAVAKGSNEPARFIVMKYVGNPQSQELLALIGKGITFDSGGISLKPSEGMGDMKDDMAGAAAVMGAMLAIGQLKPAINIIALLPCTENMPSGRAFKPGDVISSLSGKTIEIISTDAEGRLILADAVAYARKLGATRIIDLATLTGACVVALGKVCSGVITNDAAWCQQVLAAAEHTGEKMWQLPAFSEYKEQIQSDIADLKNSGGRPAGTITAGLFIAEFAENTPWVHIDIAGTVSTDKINGYNPKGATGVGVRTLVKLVQTL